MIGHDAFPVPDFAPLNPGYQPEPKMKLLLVLAASLLTANNAFAEQAMTAGKLLANGFDVRASYQVDKGASVLVLQKGAEAYVCAFVLSDALSAFSFAHVSRETRALTALPTACAPIK